MLKTKEVRMDSWLLKLLSRDMKTKNKDQPTNSDKEKQKKK